MDGAKGRSCDLATFRWTRAGAEQGEDGPGLSDLRGQEVDVLAEDADKDKDFNVVDLEQCKVTM